MRNKLVSNDMRKGYKMGTGECFPETSRCTGQTTGEILTTIGVAMRNPNEEIFIRDVDHPQHFMIALFQMITRLQLKHMVLDMRARSITFELFEV